MTRTNIIYLIAIAVLLFMLIRACNEPEGIDLDKYEQLRDSTEKVIALYKDSATYWKLAQSDNDSLRGLYTDSLYLTRHALSDKDGQMQYWRGKFRTARAGRDTELVFIACDTINAKYAELREQYIWSERYMDSLQTNATARRTLDSAALASKDTTIGRLIGLDAAKDHFLTDALRDNFDLRKKAAKRFSIGPAAGYGVGRSGLTPYIGVGVNWRVVRF